MPRISKLCAPLLGAMLLPGLASGAPSLTLQSPGQGECVFNDDSILGTPPLRVGDEFEGAIIINSVPLSLSLEETAGLDVQLEVFVDEDPNDAVPPVLVYERLITPFQLGRNPGEPYQALLEDVEVPADAITDGAERTIIVRATSDDGVSEDQVTIQLDRRPPFVYLADEDFALLDQCYVEGAPDLANLPIQVIDDQDPAPIVTQINESVGCLTRRSVTVADACGNNQVIELRIRNNQEQPTISIEGIDEGAVIFGGALRYDVQAAEGCLDSVNGVLTPDNAPASVLIPGQEINQPGNYEATVNVSACGAVVASDSVNFTVAEFPPLDLGGPYTISQGDQVDLDGTGTNFPAEIPIEWAWDTDGDGQYDDGDGPVVPFDGNRADGEYPIAVRVRAEPDRVAFAQTVVTVEDVDPICSLGGPYEIVEGAQLQLDGSGSAAAHPLDPISLWSWSFGDGQQLNAANQPAPRHAYAAEGEYTVTLTLSDIDSSCQASTTVTVVDASPIIQGAGPLASPVEEGELARFTSGLTAPGSVSEPITGYTWRFGAGDPVSGADLRNTEYTYLDDGVYTVQLTVSDADSDTQTEFQIEITDLEPDPLFTAPLVVVEGDTVVFDGRASRAGGPADPLSNFEWTFGDGSAAVSGPGEQQVTHVFQEQGTYTVTLVLADEDSTATLQRDIEVLDAEPGLSCPPRFEALEGEPVQLTGCVVQGGGPADPITRYEWTFGDGSPALVQNDGPDATYTWADDGVYTARLTVYDEEDTGTSTDVAVVINNRAPVLTIEADTLDAELGAPITFTATVDDAPGDVPRLRWEMGNGTVIQNQSTFSYTYPNRGVYQVRATVEDGDGGSDEAQLEIRVGSAPPRIDGPLEISGAEGELVEATYTVTPALRDEGLYDAPVQVQVSNLPEGAVAEITPPAGDNPADPTSVVIRWTPSFVDAGAADVRISARPPSGNNRDLNVTFDIEDRGTPVLAASGGTADRGRLLLFQYGFDPILQRQIFTPWADLTVGQGAGGLAASADGSRLFVATPGSGGVAVADLTGDAPAIVRVVPTGADTVDVVYGGGRIWALSARTGVVSLIDPNTLKVVRTVSSGAVGPVDMIWLDSGFGGLPNPHLAIVAQGSPSLILLNAARANAGLPNIITDTLALGGRPQRLIADPRDEALYIADGKGRRVQRVTVAADLPAATSVSLDFAPKALALNANGGVLAATDAGVFAVDGEAGEAALAYDLITGAMLAIEEQIRAEQGLALTEGNQIIHLSAGQDTPELPGPAARVRHLSAFIVPQQEAVR